MAYITKRIGKGPGSFEMSVSDIYANPVEHFKLAQHVWDLTHDTDGNRIEPPLVSKKPWYKQIFDL